MSGRSLWKKYSKTKPFDFYYFPQIPPDMFQNLPLLFAGLRACSLSTRPPCEKHQVTRKTKARNKPASRKSRTYRFRPRSLVPPVEYH